MNNRELVKSLHKDFNSTLTMLERLIESCPQEIWESKETLFWQHIFHAITGIEFWFRNEGEKFFEPVFRDDVTPDFEKKTNSFASKIEMKEYLLKNKEIAEKFFINLDNESLLDPCEIYKKMNKADAALMQIRHIQHHIGYCNCLLTQNKQEAVEWIG